MDETKVMHKTDYKPLLRLTMIGNPDFHDGKPTDCYVDAELIVFASICRGSFTKDPLDGNLREFHPRQTCTMVYLRGGSHLLVLETPEQVNEARNAVLGLPARYTQ
jgi:hypothetical protein